VKIICSIIHVDSFWVAWLSVFAFIIILSANAQELIYFMTKVRAPRRQFNPHPQHLCSFLRLCETFLQVFFHSILSIFFSSMEVIGKQNVPAVGPVIFTGNHMNQFVDGAVILITNPRRVGFLVAEASMKKRVIGDFARACGSIAVARPQDTAKPGPGRIYFDKLRPARRPGAYRVVKVISDTEGILGEDPGDGSPLTEQFCQGEGKWATYDVMGYVDQSGMFSSVHSALANGSCIGIFPEGGSHDNTDLLPLKVSSIVASFHR